MESKVSTFARAVWVSYAGQDHDLVEELAQHVEAQYAAAPQGDDAADGACPPFRLITYKRDGATSEPLRAEPGKVGNDGVFYFLRPGESIGELVQVIASTLRRLLVISPAYLKSEHCLWELCSCLTNKGGGALCIVLKEFDGFDEILQARRYPFLDGPHSLACALAHIYKEKVAKMPQPFRLSEDHEADLEGYFKERLDRLKDRRYLNETKVIAETDGIARVCKEIARYVAMFKPDQVREAFYTFYRAGVADWCDSRFGRWCVRFKDKAGIPLGEDHLNQADIKGVTELVNKILIQYKYCKEVFSEDKVKGVKQLAGLLALKMIDPEWAAEMHMSSLGGLWIRIAETTGRSIQSFACQIAPYAIQQCKLELEPEESHPKASGLIRLNEGAFEQQASKREKYKQEKLTELVCRVMGKSVGDVSTFLKQDDWSDHFRAAAYNNYMVSPDGKALVAARFYIDRDEIAQTQRGNSDWSSFFDEILVEINRGAEDDDRLTLGVIVVTTRDEGNLIQLIPKKLQCDRLFDHIKKLMGLIK